MDDDLQRLAARIKHIQSYRFKRKQPLKPFHYMPLENASRDAFNAALPHDDHWKTIPYNTYWGNWQTNFAMVNTYQIPADWALSDPTALYLPMGNAEDWFNAHPEALIYIDDNPFTTVDARHTLLYLPDHGLDHQPHKLSLHGWTGLGGSLWGDNRPLLMMQPCAVVQVAPSTDAFITLAEFTLEAILNMPPADSVRVRLLNGLEQALNHLDTRHAPNTQAFYASVPGALALLRAGIAEAGEPLPITVHAVGHAHIDTAWLWQLEQTRGKTARSFHTAIYLMERNPSYRFIASQPQLYEFVRQDYPDLFRAIQQKVRDGQWEPLGGMWVEADANITGAESLIRQFVLGQAFFEEHFGANTDSKILWLPDTFGFPASLPQVARLAGFKYFFTIKPRWNEVNQIPYDAFWWEGLDGSQLLAHFSTTPTTGRTFPPTYNAELRPEVMRGTWEAMRQKPLLYDVLTSYGWGDGGGGPTQEMLDHLALLNNFPGLPRVKPSRVIDFYKTLEATHGDTLPKWVGELYLETHQGTFTSQANIKRAVHDTETRLHDIEFLAVYAQIIGADYTYPAAKIRECWRTLCLNHFHDILPGSSIAEVYEDAAQQFNELTNTLESEKLNVLAAIGKQIGGGQLIVNTTGFERFSYNNTVEPFSVAAISVDTQSSEMVIATETLLENSILRVTLNNNGDIVSIFDKEYQREILTDIGNQFQLFEDRPLHFDAWNIDRVALDQMWTTAPAHHIAVIEVGNHQAAIEIERRINNSTLHQQIILTASSRQLDFKTEVDWQERSTLLKVAFPVNIRSSRAVYGIQWGYIERPTHRNTTWDQAQYEVPHHRYMMLAEGNYAVALLNDGKYGCDITENLMRLTLLKSATYPDPQADGGTHRFRYALYLSPTPDLFEIVRAAYVFNYPLLSYENGGGASSDPISLVQTPENVVIETIKPADDGRGFILRLYEMGRCRGKVQLNFGLPLDQVWLTNIYEHDTHQLIIEERHVMIDINPFQIVSLRVIPD